MATENDDLNIHINVDPSGAEQGSTRAKSAISGIGNEARQLDSAFRRLMGAIDPTFAAQEKYNSSLTEARQLWAAGRISAEEYRQGVAAARQELAASTAAIAANTAEARAAAAAIKQAAADEATARRTAAREAVRAAAEAAKAKRDQAREETAAARLAAEESRKAGVQARALANAERELLSSINPVYAAQQRYNETMRQATQLLMANRLSTGQWSAIQKNAATQMEINTRNIGRQNTAYVQLGYQAQDVTASLASGINPLVILAQQGGQTASAMAQMGGRFSSVAAFMAGPWGAAIFGAILALGMLIPKLFDTESAADAAAAGQKRFADMLDSTNNSISTKISWLERLAEANNQARDAEKGRAEAAQTSNQIMNQINKSLTGTTAFTGPGMAGVQLPAEITGQSAARIQRWITAVRQGKLSVAELTTAISGLARTDTSVAKLSNTIVGLGGGMQKTTRDAEVAEARRAQLLGQQLTDRQKKLLDIKDTTEKTTEAELKANVELAVSTDEVEKARARLTIAEAAATRVRAKMIADGKTQAEADKAYQDGITKETAALKAAEAAKASARTAASAARKQDRADAAAAKRELQERQRYELEDLDYQRDQATNNYNEQMRIQEQKIAKLKEFYGEDSRNYVQGLREKERMERAHQQEMIQIARDAIQRKAELDTATAETDLAVNQQGSQTGDANISAMKSMGMLNQRQEIEARRVALEQQYQMQVEHENRIYAIKLQSLRDQLALLPQESREHAQVNNQIEMAEAEHSNRLRTMAAENFRGVAQINLEAAQNSYNSWKSVTDNVGNSFNQMFQGIWMKSGNFRENLLNIADQLVFKFVQSGIEMASSWVAQELIKTNASVAGNAARTAATTAAATAQTGVAAAAGTAEITTNAAVAAAGAYKSTVVIPYIGPIAAPAAAALALGAVLGFGALISARGGQGEVPYDGQMSMLHKKEMVLPAWIAEPLRQSIKSPRSVAPIMSGAMQGGAMAREAASQSSSLSFSYAPTVYGNKDDFDTTLRKNARQMRKWAKNQQRNGAFRMDQTR